MQLFEFLFLALLTIAIARIVVGSRFSWLRYSVITGAALVAVVAGLAIEGWRWQLIPAYLAFLVMALLLLRKSDAGLVWRLLGAVPLTALTGVSIVLALLMPVVSLPAPAGPYGVGTFDFSITDPARVERYAPERNRELYVEVWYPADKDSLDGIAVQTMFHDLYRGDYNRTSFLFGYTKHIDTHSHIQAPVAKSGEGRFPVLLFNHARDFGVTSQNQLLMEHLASHGYVVFSIAHPYNSSKVNLASAGTVFRNDAPPADIKLPRPETPTGIVGRIMDTTNGDMKKVSEIKTLLYPFSRKYVAMTEGEQAAFLQQTLESPELKPFKHLLTEELMLDFVDYEYTKDNSLIQYWVEDNQFIADSLTQLKAPVAGFTDMLDPERLGVFGMSYGGGAAVEFCKVDRRCKASVNLDGSQWGAHWDTQVPVPFLMLYHDGHEGGNDFAYLPANADYWEYRIRNTAHTDFTDFSYLWPILKPIGFAGSIDGWRMMDILNTVNLNFFDHYLKGKAIPGELYRNIPEIDVRRHGQ